MKFKLLTRFGYVIIPAIAFALFVFNGCSKDNPIEPQETTDVALNADVAESVASSVGEEDGGLTDQIGDLFELTAPHGLNKSGEASFLDKKEATYDSVTGIWTIELTRERGNPVGTYYANIQRTYTCQFLNADGQPQKFYVTGSDTAHTIKFDIVEGEGRHKTKRLSQQLHELEGSFVATGTNTDMIIVNGTYKRSAADTLTTLKMTRTHDHTLELTITDLTGPRGSRRNLSQKVSGTITGTYHADITFDGKKGYAEKTVDRNINIIIGDGESEISVAGEKYKGDLMTGEIE